MKTRLRTVQNPGVELSKKHQRNSEIQNSSESRVQNSEQKDYHQGATLGLYLLLSNFFEVAISIEPLLLPSLFQSSARCSVLRVWWWLGKWQ